ncbi:MAG: Lpg1974 family pore-forming outer membrane protein [Chlamydiota bacterium]
MFFKKSSLVVFCTFIGTSIFADLQSSEPYVKIENENISTAPKSTTKQNIAWNQEEPLQYSTQESVVKTTPIERGYALPDHSLPAGYNSYGRIDTRDSYGFFLHGSFLYWFAKEKGLDVAQFHPTDANTATGRILQPKGEYKCGFDAGFGFNFDYDHWTLDFNYTRLHSTESVSSGKPDNGTLIPHWLIQSSSEITHVSAKWRLALDLLDLQLSRAYYQGTHLIFIPFYGLRGGWIDQKYNAKYTLVSVVPSKHKTNSWIIGPRIGTEAKWLLDAGFRFYGKGAVSLFFQRFNRNLEEMNLTTPSSIEYKVKNQQNFIQPNAELTLGLGYGTYFCNGGYHFDISAGYTFQIFWNQNMMRALKDSYDTHIDGNAGDLVIHGLIASLRFDF